jgi:hypothetical protein
MMHSITVFQRVLGGGASEKFNLAYSADPTNIEQGDKSIEYVANSYSSLQFDNSPTIPSTAKGVRFYAKATTAGTQNLRLILNYSYGTMPLRDLGSTFQYYEVPWSAFGLTAAPSNMNMIFNNYSGAVNTIYLDDIGYYN